METAVVCNIGKHGRASRARLGKAALLVAAVLLVALVVLGAALPWRLLVVLPVLAGAGAFLEARRSVCVALALTGTMEDEEGNDHQVSDQALVRAARVRSRRIVAEAMAWGLVSAVVAVASSWVH
jgi:hypothetical protein